MKKREISEQFRNRVDELLSRLDNVISLAQKGDRTTIDLCFMGTLTIIESLYGANSSQMKALSEAKKAYIKPHYSTTYALRSMGDIIRGTLLNIREELDTNLIRNIKTEAAGAVIGDLVALAKEKLKAGYSNVAAVLVSAALEDALKRKAEEFGINVGNKTLSTVISSLKSKSFFKGAQVPIITSYIKMRNAAMHADWDKIQKADISSLIGFLEPFLLEHFS